MVTREEIEGFLGKLTAEGASYSEVEPGLWAVRPEGELDLTVVVHHSPPVVVLRVKVMELPKKAKDSNGLCKRLLELNATDLLRQVSGTVFKDKLTRIVDIDGYALEVKPRGNMILFTNKDKPGVVGAIGTALGECKVNIAGMTLAREREGGHALALLLVDGPVGPNVLDRLLKIEHIVTAKALRV
jgi:D-3-phosphoglycerate dehydrogenase